MARIRVVGCEEAYEAPEGSSLLAALQKAKHPISTSCGGRATCGLCQLTVTRGREFLSPVNDEEVAHLGNVAKVVDIRLACQAVIVGDGEIEVDVPPVVDIAARKREQTRRGFAERAIRRRSRPGSPEAAADRPSQQPIERIEWRPRKLEENKEEDGAPKKRRRRRRR